MAIRAIIDTNVLVSALSSKSKNHWLVELLLEEQIELFVTEEILLEYEEILKSIVFPKVNVVNIEEFKASLEAK
jgi:putative PIN family toxin of toxin-antitoxin system